MWWKEVNSLNVVINSIDCLLPWILFLWEIRKRRSLLLLSYWFKFRETISTSQHFPFSRALFHMFSCHSQPDIRDSTHLYPMLLLLLPPSLSLSRRRGRSMKFDVMVVHDDFENHIVCWGLHDLLIWTFSTLVHILKCCTVI